MWCIVSDMLVLWNKIGKRAVQSLDVLGVLTFSIFFLGNILKRVHSLAFLSLYM